VVILGGSNKQLEKNSKVYEWDILSSKWSQHESMKDGKALIQKVATSPDSQFIYTFDKFIEKLDLKTRKWSYVGENPMVGTEGLIITSL
jgi:hypothetical protein